jgi:hypothetical protein
VLVPPLAWLLTVVLAAVPIVQATAPQTPPPAETATQIYLRYRSTVLNAKTVDEITAFWSDGLMDGFNLTREARKPATLETVKRMESRFTDVRVVREEATADGVTLSLDGIGPDKTPMTGTINLVKENGAWKIAGQEQWSPKGAPLTSSLSHPRS